MTSTVTFSDSTKVGRETFQSTEGNAFIDLGKYKKKDDQALTNAFKKTFLEHNQSNSYSSTPSIVNQDAYGYDPHPSLANTRFSKGFTRRQAHNIVNPITNVHKSYQESQVDRKAEIQVQRKENLRRQDMYSGQLTPQT